MKTRLVFGLLLLLAVQVTARGGGRSSGGGGRSYSSYSTSRSSYNHYGGGGGGPMPTWAIILIVVIWIIAIICTCISFSDSDDCVSVEETEGRGFNRTLSYSASIPCYLCLSKVSNSSWDSGEHRKRCAYNNQRELLSYPQPYESFCPNCHEKLSLWPAKGHPFYCDQCPFDQRSVLKRSTGQNRLNCFLCDFDCCVNCANEGKMQRRLSLEHIESGGFSRTLSYSGKICYLCLGKVKNTDWNSGEHRRQCASDNQRDLQGFKKPYQAFCPTCSEQLSLMPPNGQPFYCNQCPDDKRNVRKMNTKYVRLNCFLCDFDCCVNCAMRGKLKKRFYGEKDQRNTEQAGRSNEVEKFIDSESNPTPPYNPYHTDTTTTSGETATYTTPFIIPQQNSPPAYPAPEYHAYIDRTSKPPSVPYYIQPTHPIAAPSDHPSLPYAIQPTQQHQSTESSTPWAPSAPPLINKNSNM